MKRKLDEAAAAEEADEPKEKKRKTSTTTPALRTKFVANSSDRRRWLILDYLQKQVKEKGFDSASFWHHLDLITDNETVVLVDAKNADELCGYVCGSIVDGRIELIEVNPKYRRLGLGKALVEEFARVCERDLDEIWASKVLSTAQNFWASLGFRWRYSRNWSCPREKLYRRVQTRSMTSRSNQ